MSTQPFNAQNPPLTFAARAAILTKFGIPAMPLEPRGKTAFLPEWQKLATIDAAQIARWDEQNPDYNCAAVGRKGGFWILDVDAPSLAARIEQETGHSLDELDTLVVKSSGEKRHYYFKHDARSEAMGNVSADDKDGEIFSVRGNNAYVVSAGSIHPKTGQPYEIVLEPMWGEIPAAPDWLVEWLLPYSKKQGAPKTAAIPEPILEHSRNKTLASLAGAMRRPGMSEDAILAGLQVENQRRCQPPLPEYEVRNIAKSIAKYEPTKSQIEVTSQDATVSVAEQRPDMPRTVLSGRLGEICEKNMLDDFPISYAWLSLVTAASVLVPERPANYSGGDNLHNLYTALVGPVNCGKSQAIEWAMKLLRIQDDPRQYSEVKPGSAERLLKHMNRLYAKEQLGPRVLMFLDEWKFFFDKAGIERSVFPTLLTTGFYRKNTTILDSNGNPLMVPAAFSWIGGIVTDSYDDCLSHVTSLGLHDRLLQGINPSSYTGFNYRPFDGEMLPKDFVLRPVQIDRTVWECLKAWRGANPQATREAEIAFRIAEICASFDGAPTLYGKDLAPHLILAGEQRKLRETLKPNVGETPDARCSIKVENYLKAHGPAGEWRDFRVMMKDIHYERFGPHVFERTIRGLTSLKIVETDQRSAGAGNLPGGRPAKVIRLVLE